MSSSSNRPPTVLNPTLLNDIYKRSLKHEKNLKETLQRKSNFTEANSNCDEENNDKILPRRVSSWVVPTQDQIRNSFTNLNKLSDQDSNSRNSLRNENKISTQGLNISKRSDSKYSLQSNDFSHINKVFKSTNVLAEDFRDMIKSDRKVFLQDYNKIENKLMLLMEAFKN